MEIMNTLEVPYYNLKDISTSSQIPGSIAPGDKTLGFFSGILAGYRTFKIMPLSTDQGWSSEQTILDIQHLQNSLITLDKSNLNSDWNSSYNVMEEVIDNGGLFAENTHTLMNMSDSYDVNEVYKGYYSSEIWKDAGRPKELNAVSLKIAEYLDTWAYRPSQEKLEKIVDIYVSCYKEQNTKLIDIE